MGVIKVQVPDKVEEVFRMLAMKRFGYRRGSISEAVSEALEKWAASQKKSNKDHFGELRGILKHVKKSSVELQHEAWNSIYEKHTYRR